MTRRRPGPMHSAPPAVYLVGKEFRVLGYHTGDFCGRLESIDRDIAVFTVTDNFRRVAIPIDRCSYPGCILSDLHDGPHEFDPSRLLVGSKVEVAWRVAKLEPRESAA